MSVSIRILRGISYLGFKARRNIFNIVLMISLLYFNSLNSIQLIDNRIFFDILLDEVNSFELNTQGNFYLQTGTETISLTQKKLKISYLPIKSSFEVQTFEQISHRSFVTDSIMINSWEGEYFQFKKREVYISQMNFSSQQKAVSFAKSLKIKKYKILQESGQIMIQGQSNGKYSLPVQILSDAPIEYSGTKYNGLMSIIDSKQSSMRLINTIDMEEYVAGVVPYEIGLEAPYEALKAQAVAARSQTISKILYNRHNEDGYDLCNNTHCQVYKGLTRQNENTYRAAIETSNEILTYENKVIDAVFHSCCGGATEDAKDAWGGDLPYLRHVKDYREDQSDASEEKPYCSQGGKYIGWYDKAYQWTEIVKKKDIELRLKIGTLQNIEVLKRGKSGRVHKIKFTGSKRSVTLTKELEIRAVFNNAKSSSFYLTERENSYKVSGKGMGHGVGMCQIGAIVQAHIGYSYLDILLFYYQGTQISNHWILEEYIKSGE